MNHQNKPDTKEPKPSNIRYSGKVRVLLPFDPWRILVSLRGIQLSTHGLDAMYQTPPSGKASVRDSVDALMIEGDPYELQLEHDEPHLSAPVLKARLVRRLRSAQGLELSFAFDAPDSDLLGLMHELMAGHQ